jgi:hypothetical protein
LAHENTLVDCPRRCSRAMEASDGVDTPGHHDATDDDGAS